MADRAPDRAPDQGADHTRLGASEPRPLARRAGAATLLLEPRPSRPGSSASARSGPVRRPVERPDSAVLLPSGLPLLRRTRLGRTRLERLLGGSAIAHALALVALALLFASQQRPKPPQEPPAVEMVYGQSGMVGEPSSTDAGGGGKPSAPPAPDTPKPDTEPPAPPPQQEPAVNTELPPAPPPVPIPDFEPLPLPPPPPPTPRQEQRQTPPMRIPLNTSRPTSSRSRTSSNAFSHPMDLSFSQAGPPRARTGRPSGSHAPIDMSLGPLVKNGHLNTPYATVGVKGVSDDYGAEIDSWIRRHLYYPPDAAQRGEQGPSHVHVQIDRSGRVKSVRLVDSSGSYALDDSTMGMFRGRSLPPVPPDMQGETFDIDLTVNYILTH